LYELDYTWLEVVIHTPKFITKKGGCRLGFWCIR